MSIMRTEPTRCDTCYTGAAFSCTQMCNCAAQMGSMLCCTFAVPTAQLHWLLCARCCSDQHQFHARSALDTQLRDAINIARRRQQGCCDFHRLPMRWGGASVAFVVFSAAARGLCTGTSVASESSLECTHDPGPSDSMAVPMPDQVQCVLHAASCTSSSHWTKTS